jgi:hypothetical protein
MSVPGWAITPGHSCPRQGSPDRLAVNAGDAGQVLQVPARIANAKQTGVDAITELALRRRLASLPVDPPELLEREAELGLDHGHEESPIHVLVGV